MSQNQGYALNQKIIEVKSPLFFFYCQVDSSSSLLQLVLETVNPYLLPGRQGSKNEQPGRERARGREPEAEGLTRERKSETDTHSTCFDRISQALVIMRIKVPVQSNAGITVAMWSAARHPRARARAGGHDSSSRRRSPPPSLFPVPFPLLFVAENPSFVNEREMSR